MLVLISEHVLRRCQLPLSMVASEDSETSENIGSKQCEKGEEDDEVLTWVLYENCNSWVHEVRVICIICMSQAMISSVTTACNSTCHYL